MATSRQTLLCDICTKRGQTNAAIGICSQCREMYCDQCQKQHQAFLATKTHKIIKFDSEEEILDDIYCDLCMNKENQNNRPTYLCNQCRELYCEPCKKLHLFFKATSDHDVSEINITVTTQPLPADSVKFTSDFEKFTLSDASVSDLASASYQDQIDHVNSSDFDGFNHKQDSKNDNLAAQFPVFQSSVGESKICPNKDDVNKISAEVIGSFKGKITVGKKLLNLTARLHRDKEFCMFTGIICLNDGRLILLDCNNEKLKMFDKTYNIISTKPINRFGRAMAKISEDEIAVVMDRTVNFYCVTKNKFELNELRNIELGCKEYGISYNRGMLAVACIVFSDNHVIKIYFTTGEEMSQITLTKDRLQQMNNLDSEEYRTYLSLSLIHYSFSCLSQQGEPLWKFYYDVDGVLEFYDCLLVARYFNGTIDLYTKAGRYFKTLIRDGSYLTRAQYMALNAVTQQLYVTRLYTDDITIIQLQSMQWCRPS